MTRLADVMRLARQGAEMNQAAFTAPDDDWIPVMIAMGQRARDRSMVVAFELPSDDEGKNEMVATLAEFLRANAASACALVLSSWRSDLDPTTLTEREQAAFAEGYYPDASFRASRQPNRVEVLLIQGFGTEGTAMLMAEIQRDGLRPPTLGPWQSAKVDLGRFDDLRRVLR